jgi:hypothetical protein
MDPYLEDPAFWEGFHEVFAVECMYQLSERLPENYIATLRERVHLVSAEDESAAQYLPDVAMGRRRGSNPVRGSQAGGVALAPAPVMLTEDESIEVREVHVEIQRLPDYQVVTAIKLLSPWNKLGEGVGVYRAKRGDLLRSGVHVVELDLLVCGRRTELAQPLPAGDYYAMLFRADHRPDVEVYAWGVRDRLPVIPVPLKSPDADVPMDLAAIVNTAYERGRYDRKLPYNTPTPAPLASADLLWAAQLLKRA